MVARTPPASPTARPHLIPREILKGLKFKQRSRHVTDTTPVSGEGVVALVVVNAFAKFKERGFTAKTITKTTQTTALSGGGEFYSCGGTCRNLFTCQI